MNFAKVSPGKTCPALACPRCGSIECSSNRIPNVGLSEAMGNALTDYRAGYPRLATKLLVAWVCVELASILRGKHFCDYCHYTW